MKDATATTPNKDPLFEPGTVGITTSAVQAVGHDDIATTIMVNCLQRHVAGDFGDVCAEEVQSNMESIKNKRGVIRSSYGINTAKGGIRTFMITNIDQNYTALMLDSEY